MRDWMNKGNNRRSVRVQRFLCMMIILAVLSACSSNSGATSNSVSSSSGESGGSTTEKKELVKVKQVTNWFAEPEHGGQYAALFKGFYEEAGLEMEIQPGGPQVSATQIVSSGQAMFGMTQADDLLIARKQGIPLVAIAALFQKSPQGLIYHANQDIQDFSDLNGRTVYTATAASYWEYIKAKYKLTDVKEMKYTGSMVNFVGDDNALTQGYITAEPYSLKQQGVETKMLLNADSGYNPYNNVLFTTEETIQKHPELVKAFVEASIKGWDYYKDNSEEVNPFIHEYNPDYSLEQMTYGAEAQLDFVYGGDAAEHGVGYMGDERWGELMDQLLDLGLITEKEDFSKVYTNEFLPGK